MKTLPRWRLKKGFESRFKKGHPWVFSNELQPLVEIAPGSVVELMNAQGDFLATGFGNLSSLISFRCLSLDPQEENPISAEALLKKLEKALAFRKRLGIQAHQSFRLVFGESDAIPGAIIDCYHHPSQKQSLWVLQAQSAGADRIFKDPLPWIEPLFKKEKSLGLFQDCTLVVKNDASIRLLEGLPLEPLKILQAGKHSALQAPFEIALPGIACDQISLKIPPLEQAQKTGFFLDQLQNIRTAASFLDLSKPIQMLDLCSYVGSWSIQFGILSKAFQNSFHTTCMDASAQARELAQENLKLHGINHNCLKADVFEPQSFEGLGNFDVIVVDPPALVKSKKC